MTPAQKDAKRAEWGKCIHGTRAGDVCEKCRPVTVWPDEGKGQ